MFKKRTLFIVGAGAGVEVGMPVGKALAENIATKLNVLYDDWGQKLVSGDEQLFSQIARRHQNEANTYQRAAWTIRDGILLINSIDDFLDTHAGNWRVQEIGKAAIVRSILEAERQSKLFVNGSSRNVSVVLRPRL